MAAIGNTEGTASGPRRPRASSWAARILACALLVGCGGSADEAPDVAVALTFDPLPRVGKTECAVALRGPDGAPLAGADIEVEGNMNHAGMVPVFVKLEPDGEGLYTGPFEFTMGGDWFVVVRGTLPDGRELERVIDVPAVPVRREESTEDPER